MQEGHSADSHIMKGNLLDHEDDMSKLERLLSRVMDSNKLTRGQLLKKLMREDHSLDPDDNILEEESASRHSSSIAMEAQA